VTRAVADQARTIRVPVHTFGTMVRHLVKSVPPEKGRSLLKQVRTELIETARPIMEAMVRDVTGVKVVSMHHDISTITGEETLAKPPYMREPR
jgi:DNA-directed RNA polymerase sigma subunit (sigma70/sigma32)